MTPRTSAITRNVRPAAKNLIETIASDERLSVFSRLMGTSGANAMFSEGGDFTVFAPTNDAFAKIPDPRMNRLLNEQGQTQLKGILLYHIVTGKRFAANVAAGGDAKTLNGSTVEMSDKGGIKVNGASMQSRNVEAANGILHTIDTVLEPPAGAEISPTLAGSDEAAEIRSRAA